MAQTKSVRSIEQLLAQLTIAALRRDVPADVADEARTATMRALGLSGAAVLTSRKRRRVEAYFAAVVKRRVLRGGVAPRAAARLLAASVVADMRSAGRDGSDIWRELERGWAERLPRDVLEEYRLRLCA
jgi:hypothetical protein